jgi:cell division protein FtsI (penicillin-binding protein 3)
MPESQSTRRLQWLLWVLLVWAGGIFARLIWLQVIHHDDLLRQAQQQQQRTVEIQAMRGSIFDRSRQPLAKSLPAESVCVNPQKIKDAGVAAHLLAGVLKLDRKKLFDKISEASARGGGFLWIKRKISADEAARVRSLNLDWVEFRPEIRRFYPHGVLAAHVLGSTGIVSREDTLERGTAGVEAGFEEDLAGQPGLARVFTDVKQNPYDSVVVRNPEPGANITLTIDANLQYDAEKELARAIASSGAKTGSIVALNPYNGDILAMANYPTYDPNSPPGNTEAEEARNNLAITTPFEPGSVFKVITISAAVDKNLVTPDTVINCGNGSLNLFGRLFHDEHRIGALNVAGVLARSSNIGAIQIALKVGERSLYSYQRRFGFGRKTGIELPGESSGMLRRVEEWTPSSIGSLAMGHEISVTSLQLALAGAAVANGGLLVKPRLVLDEPEERFAPEKPERIIAPETAIEMRKMMEGVVLHGTGTRAILKGYTSAGKTGSAQIYDRETHTYTHHYNASFLGFAPVTNPQIVIIVTLEGTSGGTAGFGGPVAAPVFAQVAMSALRMLDVPKDLPDGLRAPSTQTDGDDLATARLGDAPGKGERAVSSDPLPPVQSDSPPPAGEPVPDRRPFLTSAVIGPKVPNFRGMTLRSVLEESAAAGLQVEVLGSGLARNQEPPPGTILPPGARVRVQFVR